ncbi:hypothetical protein EX895_005044 [Sporisorium graminicola]|uniref:BZIP domain-containing protein n=1 Tax=Sporisorium graminicola TaxID=280036 RepID=A0A4V6ETD4_9BASI|nr:hypothetical protein EX895_005044 [Sporisorium graminicola]TKY86219.1 hypothetical protein EX895_005044 [Sporisorium graminicola]
MSSPAMASMLSSAGPSASSLAAHRNLAQRPLASSSSKPAPPKASSSRLAPAPSSALAPAPARLASASPPKPKAALPPPTLSASPAPSSTSSSSVTAPTAAAKKDATAGPLVQPSKEWVLPARAKPGRKPSETEPLTKRKAQNRASQRAFRERKQSYLAELEAKVAAYEAAEIDRSVEIQKVAQKLRSENETLRKELSLWKEKFAHIERYLLQAKANGGRLPGLTPSTKSGPGCKAPAHEKPQTPPKRGVLVAPGAKSERDRDRSAGGVRFAEMASDKAAAAAAAAAQQQQASPPIDQQQIAASVPLRRRPPQNHAVDAKTSASIAGPTTNALAQPLADPQSATPRKSSKPVLWSSEPPSPEAPSAAASTSSTAASSVQKTESLLSPSLLPNGGHLSVDGGCGFCTEASPCVCADDFLDLDKDPQPSHIAFPSDVPSALPLPKRKAASSALDTSRRMSIGSLTHANDVAFDQRRRASPAKKLWYTVPQPESPPESTVSRNSVVAAVPLSLKLSTKSKTGKKLWSITESPPSAEPVCTGDPSTCGACSTDPGLAAFCEAVTTAAATPTPSSSSVPSSATAAASSLLSPPRPGMLRSSTTGQLPSASSYDSPGETIPSAWRQIRSHPRFSQWQGGLDLLAEVVSKRSGNVHSPLLANKRPREASVEIEPSRSSITSTSLATSNDRATAKPVLLHTTSDTTVHIKTEEDADGIDVEREHKRRRILIDREAVQEALALLDAGTAAQPRGSVGMGMSAREEQPCPCPWRPGDKRSPSA